MTVITVSKAEDFRCYEIDFFQLGKGEENIKGEGVELSGLFLGKRRSVLNDTGL